MALFENNRQVGKAPVTQKRRGIKTPYYTLIELDHRVTNYELRSYGGESERAYSTRLVKDLWEEVKRMNEELDTLRQELGE